MKKSQNPGGFMSKLQNCKQEINYITELRNKVITGKLKVTVCHKYGCNITQSNSNLSHLTIQKKIIHERK